VKLRANLRDKDGEEEKMMANSHTQCSGRGRSLGDVALAMMRSSWEWQLMVASLV